MVVMTPELLTAFASVGTFIVIAVTAIAAILQLRHIRASNQIAGFNELRRAFESPQYQAARAFLNGIAQRMDDQQFRQELLMAPLPEHLRDIDHVGRLFETLGTYVKKGLLSEDIVCDLWSPSILINWQLLAPTVAVRRRRWGPRMYENFEMLAAMSRRWSERQKETYPQGLPRMSLEDRWLAEDSNLKIPEGWIVGGSTPTR